jgi:hypothetical protein
MQFNNLFPAWSKTWTPEEAGRELGKFEFRGEGFYTMGTDCMMVMASSTPGSYVFAIYYGTSPVDTFRAAAELPTFTF